MNDSITVFAFSLTPIDAFRVLEVEAFPAKVPILDLYWQMSIELAPMMATNVIYYKIISLMQPFRTCYFMFINERLSKNT